MCVCMHVCGHTCKYMEHTCKILCINLPQSNFWVHSGQDGDLVTPCASSSSCSRGQPCPVMVTGLVNLQHSSRARGVSIPGSAFCACCLLAQDPWASPLAKSGCRGHSLEGHPNSPWDGLLVLRAHSIQASARSQGKFGTEGEVRGQVGERLDGPRSHRLQGTTVGAGEAMPHVADSLVLTFSCA